MCLWLCYSRFVNPASIKQFIITVATASVTPTTGAVIAALNSAAVKSSITVHSSSFGALTGRPRRNLTLPNCVGLSVLTKQAIPSSQFGSMEFLRLCCYHYHHCYPDNYIATTAN